MLLGCYLIIIYIYIYIYITFGKDPRATVGLTIAENMAVNLFHSMLCVRWIAKSGVILISFVYSGTSSFIRDFALAT